MEDDAEVLDWGHEEEVGVVARPGEHRTFAEDDAEDAVSLGGDEEDDFLTYQSRVPQDNSIRDASPKNARQSTQDYSQTVADAQYTPRPRSAQERQPERPELTEQSTLLNRSFGKLVHALPPKPVVSSVPFVHPSHPSIIEATAMVSRSDREKRNGSSSKTASQDYLDPLPPGWEMKHPRSGRGVYYYNTISQESTWTRPTATPREKRRRDDPLDPLPSRRDDPVLLARVGRTDSADMSYDDRHYRPADAGRREERSAPSSQLMDSYIPDAYSPNPRNGRSSPAPRTRDNEPVQLSRRLVSPLGDRDVPQSSQREAPPVASTLTDEDRTWVARDIIPLDRPKERKQRDHSAPSEAERRNLPRDTDSSTLRPRSPPSISRDESSRVQDASIKSSQPISESPPTGRKSRFSQVDTPDRFNYRQPEPREGDTHWARADDTVPHSVYHPDDIQNSRGRSDLRGDDDTLTPPADAQRTSRKRTPLPPQDEVFRPSSRSVPSQRDSGYASIPVGPAASLRESRNSRPEPVDRSRRRSPSPSPPRVDHSTTERGGRGRDYGRSRQSKPPVNEHATDSYVPHAAAGDRDRARDVEMDIDDAPLPRSSDPPLRRNLSRRSAAQEEAPRYPRAMLSTENEGLSRGVAAPREPREVVESRQRSSADNSSRSGYGRERQTMERHSGDQHVAPKERSRVIESRSIPSSGATPRLSGTNNIPIGTRNKFASGQPATPTPPIQLNSSSGRLPPAVSGSNMEPVGTRQSRFNKDYEQPPRFDPERTFERNGPNETVSREDTRLSPLNEMRALPPVEPAPMHSRPSQASSRTSRFGPPIAKESIDPVCPQRNISSDSNDFDQLPHEGSFRAATPPPPSRESSVPSVHDTRGVPLLPPARPANLPPRPQTPPRGYQYRLEEENGQRQHRRRKATSAVVDHERRGYDHDDVEMGSRQRPASPTLPRQRAMDTYIAEPVPTRDSQDTRDSREERLRANHHPRDVDVDRSPPVSQPAPAPAEDRARAPPTIQMHPERAFLLQTQANGLPPRPLSGVGHPRPGRPSRRDRREDRDRDRGRAERAEPLRGGYPTSVSVSPNGGDHPRYPVLVSHPLPLDERGDRGGGGGGGSLLDRLDKSPALRDRVQLPSKRDREEMLTGSGELAVDPDMDDYDGSKRARRRGGGGSKARKGRR